MEDSSMKGKLCLGVLAVLGVAVLALAVLGKRIAPPSIESRLAGADAVFAGKVVKVGMAAGGRQEATIEASAHFLGRGGRKVQVRYTIEGPGGLLGGSVPEKGKEFLF